MQDPAQVVTSRPKARIPFTSGSALFCVVFGSWIMLFAGVCLWGGYLKVASTTSTRAPGQDVAILHSRAAPGLFRLVENSEFGNLTLIGLCGVILASIGGFFLVGGLWGFWVLILLACRGKNQPGWVVDRWEEPTADGDSSFCVSYRFLTPSGDPQIGAEVSHRAFHELPPGSPVTVRTVPGRPEIYRLKI